MPNVVPDISSSILDDQGRTLSDHVFEVLREYIITGELRPNQRLIESELAIQLGISRTPVREALKRLADTHHVSMLPSGGLIVTEHTTAQIQSLYEIREALETMAIKLACQQVTEEQIAKAEEYYIRSIQAIRNRKIEKYLELHGAFHEALYAPCGNEQLLSLVRTFRYQYFDRRIGRVFSSRDWRTQIRQHGRILEAVRERNTRRAEKALQQHLRTSIEVALQRL